MLREESKANDEEQTMTRTHEGHVEAQFGPRAKAYVASAVHASGPDLDALEAIVAALRPVRALDLGAGGGHVAYLQARHAEQVTAADLSSEMLAAIAETAREKGLANIETVRAPAEELPFDDGAFDCLACRYSAHHWRDFEGGLREARRVVSPGSRALFIDVFASGQALFDTHLQAFELLRDGSHVRNYSLGEWMSALSRSGFRTGAIQCWRIRMDFAAWTARMNTPAALAGAIRTLQENAPEQVRRHFAIEADGSFLLDVFLADTLAV
jgi:SAM-dependent methyltransferase